MVDGRAPRAPDEIALGATTLGRIGAGIGSTVDVDGVPHTVVGTAIMPALGQATGDHPTLATGGWLTGDGLRALATTDQASPAASAVLVDLSPGRTVADLEELGRDMLADPPVWGSFDPADDTSVDVYSPPRPGELVGISPTVTAPAVMAALLAAGAMVALGIALVASVRSRRRDLSVLKALGFTRRQVSGMVQAQAIATVLVGGVVGIPLGLALGSIVWRRFADDLGVLAETRVPVALIGVCFAAGIVGSLLFTALPSRSAARTPAALVLRSE